jgi:hypothetical protein
MFDVNEAFFDVSLRVPQPRILHPYPDARFAALRCAERLAFHLRD